MKKTFILLVAVCLISIGANAQKLGHINGQELVEHMPEYTKAYEELVAYKQQFEEALKTMEQEYQTKISEFEKNKNTWPDVIKQNKIAEIESKRQSIYDFQETASQDVSAEELKKIDPILKKAKQVIEEVAKANNYIYIFDSSTGTLLYMGGDDITGLVCTKLGIPDYTKEVKTPAAPKQETPKK